MKIIQFPKVWGRLGEARFAIPQDTSAIDLLFVLHSTDKHKNYPRKEVATLVVNLERSPQELLGEMSDTNRYEIRRAETKDFLTYEGYQNPSSNLIEEFKDFFSEFAKNRGLNQISPKVLGKYAEEGVLDISRSLSFDGDVLSWHVHYLDEGRARLLHSISSQKAGLNRSLVARANRWHHWKDMLRFQAMGIKVYDFGGLYLGDTDEQKLQINKFKEMFGGQRETGFNYMLPLSWKGKLYSWFKGDKWG